MVFGKFVSEAADLQAFAEIEEQVFGKAQSGLDGYPDRDPGMASRGDDLMDEFCLRALVFAGEEPAAIGRILFDGVHYKISGIAVKPELRGALYGDFVVRLLIDKAVMSNARAIELEALAGTEKFFSRVGFEVKGESYEALGGSWTKMELLASNIHSCCGCH